MVYGLKGLVDYYDHYIKFGSIDHLCDYILKNLSTEDFSNRELIDGLKVFDFSTGMMIVATKKCKEELKLKLEKLNRVDKVEEKLSANEKIKKVLIENFKPDHKYINYMMKYENSKQCAKCGCFGNNKRINDIVLCLDCAFKLLTIEKDRK